MSKNICKLKSQKIYYLERSQIKYSKKTTSCLNDNFLYIIIAIKFTAKINK